MAGEIQSWLNALGLGKYAEAFVENDVDLETLPDLSDDELKELGVTLGHRKKILKAISAFGTDMDAVGTTKPGTAASVASVSQAEAERRQLTVMFCDMVGSTALSTALDPEELRTLTRRYQDAVAGAVTRYGGHIAKYLGDGVLVYFGWPHAFEDQAERAVHAGLDVVAAVRTADQQLEARIGIATGTVVVGESGREAEAISGETPNRAARLQEVAEAGQVIVGDATRRLLGYTFELLDLGERELKGFVAPVRAWRVVGERQTESRFDAAQGVSMSPLVGREHEVALLLDRWRRARDGEGQVVLLSGEAGIGKSRILQALVDEIGDVATRLRYQCVPYYANSALRPIIDQLGRACGFAVGDDADARLDKLERILDGLEDTASIAALLSLPFEARYGPLRLSPQEQKARTFHVLINQLLALAEVRPVLFLFEDAHWMDPTSGELLAATLERVRDARVLMVLTHRPEFSPDWPGYDHVTALALNRLGRGQCAEIVARYADDGTLPTAVAAQIIEKADGVPLFVEELTKAVLESGQASSLSIPSTLHDSLTARLDRLASAKELAQIGAVIGREFDHDLLAAVAPVGGEALSHGLKQLVASELVFRRGAEPDAVYVFKHALVQDVAYESLLKSRRQELHARIAGCLQGEIDVAPELLAHHYNEADMATTALPYWQEAGRQAIERSANTEAIAHLKQALAALEEMPEDPERDRREFDLRIMLGPVLMGSLGWSDPSVQQSYARAQVLSADTNRPNDIFLATWGLWMHAQSRSEHAEAEVMAATLLAAARRAENTDFLLQAHHATWTTANYTGRIRVARDHIDRGIALYDREAHGHHALIYAGHDPGVCANGQNGLALWALGYADQARESARRAVSLGQVLEHGPSLAHAYNFSARLHAMIGHAGETIAHSRPMIVIADELGLPVYQWQGSATLGWAEVRSGNVAGGLERIVAALKRRQALKQRSAEAQFIGFLGQAYLGAGQLDEAEEAIREGLSLAEETGERIWKPFLLCIQADICRRAGDPDATEACLHEAIDTATSQEAKMLELRASTGLARLWAERGDRAKARTLLSPIHAWFTEGFDTPDHIAARALLDELS